MILFAGRVAAAVFVAGSWNGPAHADVLEIGAEGAHWLSGPSANATPDVWSEPAFAQSVPDDLDVPQEAMADPERSAADIPQAYNAKVKELSARFDLSPALIEALVWQESRWNAGARSPKGAHWLSGPSANATPDVWSEPAFAQSVPDDLDVPQEAMADPERSAADIPQAYNAKVKELSARFDLSPALIEALVWQESRWNAGARSPKGAQGLAQLMPGTARELGVNPADAFANLEGGARYLRAQIDRFDGDLEKALAAYNAGPGRVELAGGVPNIRETKTYVAAIMGRLSNHSRSED